MRDFTLALAQMTPRLGLVDQNLTQVLALAEEAQGAGAELVMFPELCLTGYFLRDLAREVALPADSPRLKPLYKLSHKLDIVASFVEEAPDGQLYIAAGYFSKGTLLHLHRKVYLPTYGMFEDARFFSAGQHLGAFRTPLGPMAILICEDFWHPSSTWLAALGGAQVILCPSASPARAPEGHEFTNTRWMRSLSTLMAGSYGLYVAYNNRVGYEDGVGFAGASHVAGPSGDVLVEAPVLREELLLCPLSALALKRERHRLPLLRDEDPWFLQRELERIVKAKEGAEDE